MRIFCWLFFLWGSLAGSSRAPPANKKFTQQHSKIIDAVAGQELNRPGKMADQIFKQRGLEELAPSTIRHYLKQARDRIAQSEGPAVGALQHFLFEMPTLDLD